MVLESNALVNEWPNNFYSNSNCSKSNINNNTKARNIPCLNKELLALNPNSPIRIFHQNIRGLTNKTD